MVSPGRLHCTPSDRSSGASAARGRAVAMPPPVEAPQQLEIAKRSARRIGDPLAWLLLFAAALAVRSLRFGAVATPSGVRFPSGADELYHMRRIWFTVVNFPASLDSTSTESSRRIEPILTSCFALTSRRGAPSGGRRDQRPWSASRSVAPALGALAVLAAARWRGARSLPRRLGAGVCSPAARHVHGSMANRSPVAAALFVPFSGGGHAAPGPAATGGARRGGARLGDLGCAAALPDRCVRPRRAGCSWCRLLATRDRPIARAPRERSRAAQPGRGALLPFCADVAGPYSAVTPLCFRTSAALARRGRSASRLRASLGGTALGVTRARRSLRVGPGSASPRQALCAGLAAAVRARRAGSCLSFIRWRGNRAAAP